MDNALICALIANAILAIVWCHAFINWVIERSKYRKVIADLAAISDAYHTAMDQLNERSAVAHNFINAARIIDIARNGRAMYITVMRGDETFILETTAMLSTDLPGIRKQCGLDN